MKVTEKTRSTIKLANQLHDVINKCKDSEEMKSYVRSNVFEINKKRVSLELPEIELNDVYKILGESYTCFWGLRE
jgi:hypothetical protein